MIIVVIIIIVGVGGGGGNVPSDLLRAILIGNIGGQLVRPAIILWTFARREPSAASAASASAAAFTRRGQAGAPFVVVLCYRRHPFDV